jgi:uncharacterized membrane protein YdbT with pleckstrin-like domain
MKQENEENIKDKSNSPYDYIEKKRTKFLALPLYFTKYYIGEEKINIRKGFLTTTEDDTYMYKVQDVRLTRSLMEKMFKLGTVICYTGDTTDPTLELQHIKHSKEIKEYLIQASEEARLRRRTRYNVDVGSDDSDDDNDNED